MAVIFAEQSETGSMAWLNTVGGWTVSSSVTAGPWSTYSMAASNSDAISLWTAAPSEFWGQARVFWEPNHIFSVQFIKFVSPNGTVNVSFRRSLATKKLEIYKGDAATLLATSTTVLNESRWYYFQWHLTIHDTTGTVEIKIDGSNETLVFGTGTFNTQDTRADGGAGGDTCDRIHFDAGSADAIWVDDAVINDATDTDNVSYPNHIGIEALLPSAAGDVTGLVPTAGSNFQCVDERPPNDATDYVSDSVVNDYDLYNIPSTQWNTVAAVVLPLRCQKSDAGAAGIAHMVKYDTDANGTADTENTGADVALSTSWTYHTKIYNRQPDASAWSAAKVNALQIGAKVRP